MGLDVHRLAEVGMADVLPSVWAPADASLVVRWDGAAQGRLILEVGSLRLWITAEQAVKLHSELQRAMFPAD